MVAKYKQLKKQIEVMERFKEVSTAIRFVAGGELGRLRPEIKGRFVGLTSVVPILQNDELSEDISNSMVVCITDDRGTCGMHNLNVLRCANEVIDDLIDSQIDFYLYSIGRKGRQYFKTMYKRNYKGYTTQVNDVRFSIDIAYLLFDKISSLVDNKVDQFFFIFNRYYSVKFQTGVVHSICNLADFKKSLINQTVKSINKKKAFTFWSSLLSQMDYEDFANSLYNFSVSLFLVDALDDNRYSFLAGRFNAMDEAIRNSNDMISHLTVLYHKARQDYITNELLEITTCKEVLDENKKTNIKLLRIVYENIDTIEKY
jgi:F-type H+-transporting ATPase subunit gamma